MYYYFLSFRKKKLKKYTINDKSIINKSINETNR